jgi:hypothetical protein
MSDELKKQKPEPTNLDGIRKRLAQSQEVVVDEDGKLHIPEQATHIEPTKKTVVKPSRWFAANWWLPEEER